MHNLIPSHLTAAAGTSKTALQLHKFSHSKLIMLVRRRWLPLAILALTATATVLVIGQTATPKTIALSSDPLFANATSDKPAMALALSVEYPTVGAQYRDANYSNTNEYLGYYDAESCYRYNDAPTESRPTGVPVADYKRFDRSGAATLRKCSDAFSGNFLNWATSSSIDMLRLALSGGDRVVDTVGTSTIPSLTILQRAVLPNGDPTCMWNSSSNFPAKQLPRAGGTSGSAYFGAVPLSMQTGAGTNDIWVANTLNQIYFGTASGGGCGNTGTYTLGVTSATSGFGPITNPYLTRTTAYAGFGSPATACASENGTCSFTGVKEVLYGAQGTSSSNGGWIVFPASNGVACSNNFSGAFVDPAPGTGKNCYIRDYTGTWTPPASGITSDAFFYSRVQVCNISTATPATLLDNRDYGLCTQYPNGFYKPTGSIQKYSDQLRLAAFGYLMDQTQSSNGSGRYGGVLRAPMKFVGAKTFDESGLDNTPSGGNPKAEWDANSGVFKTNPDGDTTQTTPISGVINYLNKFGRTGPTAGRYKIYDPVGELYGEALRYLQGLSPTTVAVSSISTDMYDGFPAFATWTDPYGGSRTSSSDYSCLKSNIVVVGDVNTHDSNRLLTRTTDVTNNLQDFSAWKTTVNNFESNTASTYVDGQSTSRTTGNPNTPNTSSQTTASGSQVLTGQAYWAHTHDIRGTGWTAGSGPSLQRPGLRVKSYFFDVNEGSSSNSASYRQNQNQFFTSAKYGGFESDASNIGGKPYNTYGNPFKRQDGTNDNNVWQNTATPGDASTYYLSSSARGTLTAFDTIFSRASTAAKSIAGIAASSKNFDYSGSTAFQGAFDTSDWSGDVTAKALILNSANQLSVSDTVLWSAAARLNNLSSPSTTRNIVVGRPGASSNPIASAFTWTDIDTAMKSNLALATPSATADLLGQDRLNFLRGDNSKEGSTFRTRSKLIGDIVNSGVVYSGPPSTNVSGDNGYSAFYATNTSRTPAVFVGANDGMLHAFNATTGDELFGYIPSWMGPKLAALTSTTYVNNHQSYVDASPVVAEAQVGATNTAADWKSVLVSGTGAGGPGVFALDVTNPGAFSASKVMWEFTRLDDADLGYVVGRPQIVKMKTSAPGAAATFRWFAMVASGVNNYAADTSGAFIGATINTSGGAPALFLLALDKPVGAAWTATGGSPNYYKISVPTDSTLSATNGPGLINFKPNLGSVKEVTQVYMGDLHGKLWKLDFSLQGMTNWTMSKLSSFKDSTTLIAYPLFTAQTGSGAVQSITMPPTVVTGPVVSGLKTYYVAFGTGKYLEAFDKTSTAQNTLYAVYDNATTTADTSPHGSSVISGRARLKAGTANATTGVVAVGAFSWGRPLTDADTTQRAGWYADFATSGERQIGKATVFGDFLTFGSLIPASAGATGSCTAGGGSGNSYIVNIDTGNGAFKASTVGLLGESLLAELLPATSYTTTDSTGRRYKTITKQLVQQGSLGIGSSTTDAITSTFVTGRLSWRQINNYQDLKNAP